MPGSIRECQIQTHVVQQRVLDYVSEGLHGVPPLRDCMWSHLWGLMIEQICQVSSVIGRRRCKVKRLVRQSERITVTSSGFQEQVSSTVESRTSLCKQPLAYWIQVWEAQLNTTYQVFIYLTTLVMNWLLTDPAFKRLDDPERALQ